MEMGNDVLCDVLVIVIDKSNISNKYKCIGKLFNTTDNKEIKRIIDNAYNNVELS